MLKMSCMQKDLFEIGNNILWNMQGLPYREIEVLRELR